ncbi:MAG: AmmeMemoRadiSam system protein A [Leptolinea sp.]
MKPQTISKEDRQILLELARRSLEAAARKRPLPRISLADYSNRLQQNGASFVTLTSQGALRGCIGTLEAYQSLVQDVCDHAASAAIEDFRFSPVSPVEVQMIAIEVSVLTAPVKLEYETPVDLMAKLSPGEDGVILRDGRLRATFLPQVWDQLADKAEFLSHLCSKMGAAPSLWKIKNLEVFTYQVEEFRDLEAELD